VRQSQMGTTDRLRRRAAALGVVAIVSIVGLTGASAAQAAPRDNLRHAAQCLNGGWHTLKRTNGASFRNLGDCVVYALRGGLFAPTAPPTDPPVEPGE